MKNKLYEYLQLNLFNEDEKEYYCVDGAKIYIPNNVKEKIKYECSDIIYEYNKANICFLRGVSSIRLEQIGDNISSVFKCVPRHNRRPKDTLDVLHNDIDNLFYEKFKWHPRSEGVFVSTNKGVAITYGSPYIFLPKNGYKFIYSKNISDLYSDRLETFTPLDDRTDETTYIYTNINDEYDIFDGYIPRMYNPIKNGNMYTIIIDGVEKTYIKTKEKSDDDIAKEYLDNLKEIVDEYTDKNIQWLLNSSNENECVFKCDYYYLISIQSFNKVNFKFHNLDFK